MDLIQKKDLEKFLRDCNKNIPLNDFSLDELRKNLMKKNNIPTCLQRSKKNPHDFQEKIVDFMMKNRGLIVYHKVGSGKTLTAILVSQCFLDKYPYKKVIVITPAGLLANFKKEMNESYEQIRYKDRYEFYSYHGFVNKCRYKTQQICKNSLLIIDEGHNLRTPYKINKKGKVTGLFNGIITNCSKFADKVLILTGTPLYNSKNDIIALYNMIRFPKEPYETIKTFSFNKLICKISFFDPKNNSDFPKKINHFIPIVMNKSYEKKYEATIDSIFKEPKYRDFLTLTLFGDKDLQTFYNAIRRAINNLENKDSAKIQWIINKITDKNVPKPVIVFSHFLKAGNKIIAQILKEKKIPYAYINGDVPLKERTEIVKKYNNREIEVLLLSKAGGEGLDLKNTRTVILLEPSWNEATIEQVIGRAIRYKSHIDLPTTERVVDIYYLDHIRHSDMIKIPNIKKWVQDDSIELKDKNKRPAGFNPYDISVDLFLRSYIKKKQKEIDLYNKFLQKYSIENYKCP